MILNIIIYFFLIFGILEFTYLIWELTALKNLARSEMFIVIPKNKAESFGYEISNFVRKFPNRIYVISKEKNEGALKKFIPCSESVTVDELTEIIRRKYGNDNRND